MSHPHALEEQALARQAAVLAEAARHRRPQWGRESLGHRRPPPRPAVWLGRGLVRLGAWLQGLDPARAGTELLPPARPGGLVAVPGPDPAAW
jgi:hypothetical protein